MNVKIIMKKIIQHTQYFILTSLLILLSSHAHSADPIYTGWFSSTAIKGYDTVAYFTERKAIKGSKEFEVDWKGATWRFSSEKNKILFTNNPDKFSPQYGGYCAFAVADNNLVGVDPTQFYILNDKLYLNYNKKIQKKWELQKEAFIKKADNNWPSILN